MNHISHYTESGTKGQSHVKYTLDIYDISMTFASKILEVEMKGKTIFSRKLP